MVIASVLRRRNVTALHRLLSTAVAAPTDANPSISVAVAKSRLRKEFDPDRAVSILSSIGDSSTSPTSARFAVDLTVRRLARARRFSDIESLLESRKTSPSPPGCAGGVPTEPFLATIILSYGRARMLDHARRTFDDVPRLTGAPHSAVSLNALLSAHVQAKCPRAVPALLSELSEKHSIAMDAVSYSILIKAFCLEGNVNKAIDVLKEMVETKGFEPNTVIYTTLLDSLYKEGKPEAAEKLWEEMTQKGCPLDAPVYNVRVMHRAMNVGKPEGVLELIEEMEAAGVKPDTITYNYLTSCYCNASQFEDAKAVYRGLKKKGCLPNATTFKILLAKLSENGDLDAGMEVYKNSLSANKVPDFRTMKLFVEALVKEGKMEEAKGVVEQVKQRFPENLVGGWKKVEIELGLSADSKEPDQVVAT